MNSWLFGAQCVCWHISAGLTYSSDSSFASVFSFSSFAFACSTFTCSFSNSLVGRGGRRGFLITYEGTEKPRLPPLPTKKLEKEQVKVEQAKAKLEKEKTDAKDESEE